MLSGCGQKGTALCWIHIRQLMRQPERELPSGVIWWNMVYNLYLLRLLLSVITYQYFIPPPLLLVLQNTVCLF